MKTQKWLTVTVLVSLTALLLSVAPAGAQAEVTEYTQWEACNAPTNHGTWTFPDGNIHLRGMVLPCNETASDPRLAGSNTIVMNANWGADGLGPMWGTFRQVNEGGVWEGTWEGMMTASGSQLHITGKGSGGYEGLKLWQEGGNGVYQGRILDPHGD